MTEGKKYQVFVSSTYLDLKKERQEAMHAVLKLNCIPAGMELFPAANEDPWSLIRRVIDDCDYYLVIIGGRYGSSIMSDGPSFTEHEYDYAVSQEKHTLAFLHKSPPESGESAAVLQQLNQFRKRIQQARNPEFWSTPHELGKVITSSLAAARDKYPAVGWVRGNSNAAQEVQSALSSKATEVVEREGKNKITVCYSYRAFGQTVDTEIQMTWNEIFRHVSPHMMDAIPEFQLQSLIGGLISELEAEMNMPLNSECHVKNDDFHTIKVRLLDFGWVHRQKPLHEEDVPCWQLTTLGEHVMRLVRKRPRRSRRSRIPF